MIEDIALLLLGNETRTLLLEQGLRRFRNANLAVYAARRTAPHVRRGAPERTVRRIMHELMYCPDREEICRRCDVMLAARGRKPC